MTIARGQMNRQLYAEGGIRSLRDILEPSTREMLEEYLPPMEEREYIPELSEPQRLPKRRLMPRFLPERGDSLRTGPRFPLPPRLRNERFRKMDEELREYEPTEDEIQMLRRLPRGGYAAGGIMSVPRARYGFGSFFSSIGDALGSVGDFIGDVAETAVDVVDPIAQVASFIPGPHQPYAQLYTTARGSGIGGDYGGLQIGGFTPSGGSFGIGGGTTSPFSTSFQAGAGQAPSSFGLGSFNIPGIGDIQTSDLLKAANQLTQDPRSQTGGGFGQGQQPSSTADIIGKVIQGGLSLYGAKKSYEDQKRINEQKQREYEDMMARREAKRKEYGLDSGQLSALDVRNRQRVIGDVIGRTRSAFGGMQRSQDSNYVELAGSDRYIQLLEYYLSEGFDYDTASEKAFNDLKSGDYLDEDYGRDGKAAGGIMDLNVRTNPEGVQELDMREEGGFIPPIGVKEKADDIPAMLSNNEFVFTADAVRAAGGGSVNKGAKRMYELMKNLEAKS